MVATRSVAKSIVLDEVGRFLLLTRSETHPALAGYYDLPGGMIEPGEEPGEAVVREIKEETGLTVEDPKIAYTMTMMIGGLSYPTMLYVFRLQKTAPDIELSWEHSAYEWAPLEKLADVEQQLAPTYRQALQYIRANEILQDLT